MFIKFLLSILTDQRGEGEPVVDGGEGQGDLTPAGAGTQEPSPPPDEGQAGEGGQGGEPPPPPPVAPKYGEFGDNPSVDDVYARLQEEQSRHQTLRDKTGKTEGNLSAARNAAKAAGYQIFTDPDGNSRLMPLQSPEGQKTRKFTEKHLTDLQTFFEGEGAGQNFINALSPHFEDMLDKRFNSYEETNKANHAFATSQHKSNSRMVNLYPQVDNYEGNVAFDQKFFDLATKIWEDRYSKVVNGKHVPTIPEGELYAAQEAAIQLRISPAALNQAKKEGYEKGKENRQVLAPVGGSSEQRSSGAFSKLTKAEYMKLSPTDRDKYDQQDVESRKK